jgi:putative transposase
LVYHVLNRANRRATLFEGPGDYEAFVGALAEAQTEQPLRLLSYCLMPNHWHLVAWPEHDRALSRFIGWLTLTHTQRWHAFHGTVGSGHLYQGRFKSFPAEAGDHVLVVCRYVERNALRAGLVARAEDWAWGSLAQRMGRAGKGWPALCDPPMGWPAGWLAWVNTAQTIAEEEAVRRCSRRGRPFGSEAWVKHMVKTYRQDTTMRPPGRPRKAANPGQGLLFDESAENGS